MGPFAGNAPDQAKAAAFEVVGFDVVVPAVSPTLS